ncbi:low choriolytic enzyme-like [Nilaparvata lugens]|uniref:low choriolytic enzyme-like n=1 Tax=Nilaparvata lugens TaxID=108931 RepID=UPI000B988981|nr:low choriolytic enzyme-like [Nilaparvata lugens]
MAFDVRKLNHIVIAVVGLVIVLNKLSEGLPIDHPPYEQDGLFEGDIILMPHQISGLKNLVNNKAQLWPNKTLYYTYTESEFSPEQRQQVESAIQDLRHNTCVQFVKRSASDPAGTTYINFRNTGFGCASVVGYHPIGVGLDMFLGGLRCHTHGTIQHELLHSLGFWHEHTRPDRDSHVDIRWENIVPGREFNFKKRDLSDTQYEGMPYDYGSVMHYRSQAFSRDRVSPTIVPFDKEASIMMGQRIRFSNVDIAKLNRLYNCPTGIYYLGDNLVEQEAVIGNLFLNLRNTNTTDTNNVEKLVTEGIKHLKKLP